MTLQNAYLLIRTVQICSLEGKRNKENAPKTVDKWVDDPYLKNSSLYRDTTLDLYVTCTLYSDSKPLIQPEHTSYNPFSGSNKWDETIIFPLKHQDLPFDTMIVITIWDIYSPTKKVPIGGTSFNVFGMNKIERKGKHKLLVWQDREGDGETDTSTPGQIQGKDEQYRLEKLKKKYDRKLINHCQWLDKYTINEIEKISRSSDSLNKNRIYLTIELPEFELPVLFKQQNCSLYKPLQLHAKKSLVLINDIEMDEHPSEQKYHRLNLYDHKDLKPNLTELKGLTDILKSPPNTRVASKDALLIWRFRYYLTTNKKALTKFLRCVEWSESHQKNEALSIIPKWEPIDIADSLELLSSAFTHQNTTNVRRYAVDILRKADDEELLYYLLQLVQATKYEQYDGNINDSPLISFLFERSSKNFTLGSHFYWYLTVDSVLKTSSFCSLYKTLQDTFFRQLDPTDGLRINQQNNFVSRLSTLSVELKAMNFPREKKIEKLRHMLSEGSYKDLSDFPPIRLPVNPDIEIVGIVPEKATIYKSAKSPLGLKLRTTKGEEYGIIFKTGDDLRQDQLIIQLISLMDRLLKKENLDLKLTPYKVLATAEEDGIVEMVNPSEAMASVLSKYDGEILKFFKTHNPDSESPYGVAPDVMDNFVKSCAGYCVITYILGIGDRHLDNLLLTPNGKLFHIDFGYILGKDPKILPPPMKLCKEMVVGMGGENSKHYEKFKQLCCEAYNILRKSSHLILNLFALMADASIPSISEDKEKSILKVQEKLQLELTDQEASNSLLLLLNESVSALFPVMVEYVHKWYQYWRS
ncbi:phosphatidylinositol 3-kinase [Dictyostelium purpureum]|uniref:phosphatidylinositol 3-kinase n=1 Tax=Dictyostelium purpureum TaxID=5786 RepID=F0ZUZ3_DICPU|nr:phosphatidylinositol 3-kinase [Dictyostelium purpureum]EGC32235.1 phosphatidylinositol 3-kinase [Dictyostelium purpureum]|eukprot:XP_003291233.1 phosphatidylinositol 3-kinase [Dictyostelium purpureum]